MTRRYKNTFRENLLARINAMTETIILRKDLHDLGSPRQVSRALKDLVNDKEIVKLGYGVYAKAELSDYLDRPMIQAGFSTACIEALNRLGVDWEPSQASKDYHLGKSQQVPARFEVRLKSRFRRQLSYGSRTLRIEDGIYTK